MTKAKTAKPKKRGPREERLIISDDPAIALASLLKASRVTKHRKKQ